MRQSLRRLGLWRARRALKKVRHWRNRRFGPSLLRKRLQASPQKRIVLGSSGWHDPGWIPTDIDFLNVVKPTDWNRFFQRNSIDAMLAEHVWEHLTPEEALIAAQACYDYLRPGGYLRVAVPDGLHPSPTYREWVKVGGALPGQPGNDHKVLYTYHTLSDVFEQSGFRVVLYEYFDEAGKFHSEPWDEHAGKIRRSRRFDRRNQDGQLVFTSIILDAFKEAVAPSRAQVTASVPG